MIATSRVARQTSRWVRLAAVTVEVVPAPADEVLVTQGVLRDEALRQEAVCGAHEALRQVPGGRPICWPGLVGRRLNDAAVILGPFGRPTCAGLLLRLDDVEVAIGSLCDEWILALSRPPADVTPYWRPQQWLIDG